MISWPSSAYALEILQVKIQSCEEKKKELKTEKTTRWCSKLILSLPAVFWEKKISDGCAVLSTPLLPISEFVLDKKFQRNASEFAIFYIYKNPKLHFLFSFRATLFFLLMNAPVYVNIDQGIN